MKPIAHLLYALLSVALLPKMLLGQHYLGGSPINNYTKNDYQAGTQNWEIQQYQNGIICVANNEGLLTFDGTHWKCLPVANHTVVRSVLPVQEKIYVGNQGDFGFFKPDEKGNLTYQSLKQLVPKQHQNFSDIWNIATDKNGNIYFRATNKLFCYQIKLNKVIIFAIASPPSSIQMLKQQPAGVYFHDMQKGLIKIDKKGQKHILNLIDTALFQENPIVDVLELNPNLLLVATQKKGLFIYDGKQLKTWAFSNKSISPQSRINCLAKLHKDRIAVGTMNNGLFILDTNGNILNQINVEKGLQINDVLNVFPDAAGNLWLGLNSGIAYIELNSPFSIIRPDGKLRGTGFTVQIHQNNIYFGTSNGLYVTDWLSKDEGFKQPVFNLVKGTQGQVWRLATFNNELLMGHHEGTFRIDKNEATLISNIMGAWTQIPLKQPFSNFLVEGNYRGLSLYEWDNLHWKFKQPIEGMVDESCRIMVQDEKQNIWIAHPYRGVYKVVLDSQATQIRSLKLYNSKNGFPSDLYIHAFKIGNNVVFTAEKGIYTYDFAKDSFELSKEWSQVISPNKRTQYLSQDKFGNIWFVIDDEVGVFWVDDIGLKKDWKKQVFPQLKGKLVGGFECIYPYDEQNVFFSLEDGFIHFNPTQHSTNQTMFFANIMAVRLADTVSIFSGWKDKAQDEYQFKHHQNAFTFVFSATDFSNLSEVSFQYWLKGWEKSWSTWSTKTSKEFTNLKHGRYTFMVRAQNANGIITPIQTFSFEILPPWYATHLAKTLYILFILALLIGMILIPQHHFEKEKASLKLEQEKTLKEKEVEHKKVLEESEAAILRLEQEKLAAEIRFKNQELATTTMHLVQKGEFLNKLKEELEKILAQSQNPVIKKQIREVIKLLNEDTQLDEDWERFAHYFDQVHENFLKRLREKFPQLTPKDHRLCVYLRMNLSSKEIAPLMNISVRGVEISRYRLRKKMELSTEINLVEFMMRV